MDTLLHLFNEFNTYSKANPILAGVMGLWGAGAVTWLLRGIPTKIWHFLKHQGTTTLTMDSSQIGTNFATYNSFMSWLLKSKYMKYSRSISIGGTEVYSPKTYVSDRGLGIGVGSGTHFFTYHGWPYWATKVQLDSPGKTTLLHKVTITGLGRNRQRLLEMIEDFKYKPEPEKLEIYARSGADWSRLASILPRAIKSVVVEGGAKERVVAQIEKYLVKRDWYHERGLPYKLTFALHGPTGTGKTSLIKAVATHFNKSICTLSLTSVSDESLVELLANMPENAILLIEDFDSAAATGKRAGIEGAPPDDDAGMPIQEQKFSMLTLSGLLNAFDGIVSLDDRIIFMTTNCIDQIDPALIRPGRVDHVIEIGLLKDLTIREYVAMMFPDEKAPVGEFAPIAGCHLQAKYLEFSDDYEKFVESIPREAQAFPKAA